MKPECNFVLSLFLPVSFTSFLFTFLLLTLFLLPLSTFNDTSRSHTYQGVVKRGKATSYDTMYKIVAQGRSPFLLWLYK